MEGINIDWWVEKVEDDFNNFCEMRERFEVIDFGFPETETEPTVVCGAKCPWIKATDWEVDECRQHPCLHGPIKPTAE